MDVSGIIPCKPIQDLLDVLISNGAKVEKAEISDFHFKELSFVVKFESMLKNIDGISIDNIEKHDDSTFFCKCHWSKVLIQKSREC
jgi:hypothetical protein